MYSYVVFHNSYAAYINADIFGSKINNMFIDLNVVLWYNEIVINLTNFWRQLFRAKLVCIFKAELPYVQKYKNERRKKLWQRKKRLPLPRKKHLTQRV